MADGNNPVQNGTPADNPDTSPLPYPIDDQPSTQLPASLPETSPLLSTPSAPSLPPEGLDQNPSQMMSPDIGNVGASPLPYPVTDQQTISGQTLPPNDVTNPAPYVITNLPYPTESSGPTVFYQQPGDQPTNGPASSVAGPQLTGPPPAGPPQTEQPPNYGQVPQYTNYGSTVPPGSMNNMDYGNKSGDPNFTMPPPPPTYEESTCNITTTVPPQQYMVRSVADYPANMQCPNCQRNIVSEIEYVNGGLVYLCAFIMILIGLWVFCCCLIPFCVDGLKDVSHRCPHCKTFLGRYNKM